MTTAAGQTLGELSESPLVSVTILNYNYGRYLARAVESVLHQSYTNIEILLIDDHSSDSSLEVMRVFAADPRVAILAHDENRGYVPSLLEGCERSSGKYMAVVSADDYSINNNAIASQVALMEANPQTSFCFSAWHQEDHEGTVLHVRTALNHTGVLAGASAFKQFLESSPVLHSGALIRRDSYLRVGGYDADFQFSVDTVMWLKLAIVGDVGYINEPLFAYRAHDSNLSQSRRAIWQATDEMLRGVDRALGLDSGTLGLREKQHLRAMGRKRALVAVPTLDVFSGRTWRGIQEYWNAARRYPVETLGQRRGLALLARALLGPSHYSALRRLVARGGP